MSAPAGFGALGFDPAPGQPAVIGEIAEKYRVVGRDLADALLAINQIVRQEGIWAGEGSEAFARRVGDLPEYLDTAARSMTQAAAALDDWHRDLTELQRRAVDLEAKARQAAAAAEAAQGNPDFALANQTFSDQRSLQVAQQLLDNAARRLQEAIDGCAAVQEEARRLLEQHGQLAERTAALLRQATELAPDEPGLLEKAFDALGELTTDTVNAVADAYGAIENFVQDNANVVAKVSDVAGDIGNVLGVLSDVVPEPAGAIVGAVSAGFSLGALAGHTTAKLAGAEVAPETLVYDGLGALTSVAGVFAPSGVPATSVLKGAGYGLLASQFAGEGMSAATDVPWESPVDDFLNYWVPKDPGQGALSFLSPAATAFWNAAEQGHEADQRPGRGHERGRDKVWE
ncbi:putative T7SS-secreted protein [Amycolatopsis albispora]|uniref:Putative T7SS secretion signal domain-containing protein n=1 Tax=Amycolatopsis albispora TaxID=1804986 RepID=A0A344L5K7_9PSEU|nr:cell division protein ZapB [Amycolatopsis albispora]AXB43331.1 hypothetical protein A4R43_12855 [Amycolatopsis albispora]